MDGIISLVNAAILTSCINENKYTSQNKAEKKTLIKKVSHRETIIKKEQQVPQQPRKRGRPRKVVDPLVQKFVVKRKRGRPRKVDSLIAKELFSFGGPKTFTSTASAATAIMNSMTNFRYTTVIDDSATSNMFPASAILTNQTVKSH